MEINSICLAPKATACGKTFRQTKKMYSWARRLNEEFAKTGWGKVELARRSGIDKSRVYKYLAGNVERPRGNAQAVLADALEVNLLWLKEGVGNKHLKPSEVIAFRAPAVGTNAITPNQPQTTREIWEYLKSRSDYGGMTSELDEGDVLELAVAICPDVIAGMNAGATRDEAVIRALVRRLMKPTA